MGILHILTAKIFHLFYLPEETTVCLVATVYWFLIVTVRDSRVFTGFVIYLKG
jgi:hypothetical protein